MKKRILSILLCAVLLLSLIPSAFAAKEMFFVYAVKVEIDEPSAGQHPDFTVTPHTTRYFISKIIWHDITDDVQLHADDVFKPGHQYNVSIFFFADDGLRFSDKNQSFAALNGEEAEYTIDEDATTCSIEKTFPPIDATSITSIELTFGAKVGDDIESSVKAAFTDDMPYVLDHISCYNRTDGISQNSGKFLSGKVYGISAYILPRDGYTFAQAPKLTASVNGTNAEVNYVDSRPEMRTIVFKAGPLEGKDPDIVDSVNVTIEPAKTYEYHSYIVKLTNGCVVGGLTWKETDQSGTMILSELNPDEYFMGGTTYAAFVTVNAPEGKKFSEMPTVKVNGVVCKQGTVRNTWSFNSDTQIVVKAVFDTDPTDEPAPDKEQGYSLQTQPVEREEIPASGTAYENHQMIEIDGAKTEVQTYMIKDKNGNGTNYIRLRDLASLLNGTYAQFDVDYEQGVGTNCITRAAYDHPNGTEGTIPFTGEQPYKVNLADTRIDGFPKPLTSFFINDSNGGGHTYFKLRDLGNVLGFNVGWTSERGVFIETDQLYTAAD
ncbi:MAG: hypothetical protein IJ788_04120 [Oscillospiraceae bacterium]|nr:hypothetical protein [Oscillospiraceae bacterium]